MWFRTKWPELLRWNYPKPETLIDGSLFYQNTILEFKFDARYYTRYEENSRRLDIGFGSAVAD